MEQLSNVEKLCLAQAFYKAAGELVSTKNPDGLRAAVDDEYLELYSRTGAKTFDMKVGGTKVGSYSVKVKKAESGVRLDVEDKDALLEWAVENGYVLPDLQRIEKAFQETGEVPDGCKATHYEMPERVDGTTLRIEMGKVAEALGAQLPEAMEQLLLPEGGIDA